MARSFLSQMQRTLYLASRTTGDVNAARRGTLPKRVIKRVYHRKLISVLRRSRMW